MPLLGVSGAGEVNRSNVSYQILVEAAMSAAFLLPSRPRS